MFPYRLLLVGLELLLLTAPAAAKFTSTGPCKVSGKREGMVTVQNC